MNSYDFRAGQVRTNKIIASGTTGINAKLVIYSIDADGTPPNQGIINSLKFNTSGIGTDVFLYVSGSDTQKTVLGGNAHISGSLFVSGTLATSLGSVAILPKALASDILIGATPDTIFTVNSFGSGTLLAKTSLPVSSSQISDAGATGISLLNAASAASALSTLGLSSIPEPRRKAPSANTRLLWECSGSSGDLVNRGTEGSSGNLTSGAALVRNYLDLNSTIKHGIFCDGTSTSQASGATGVIPTSGSSSITVWSTAILPSGWTGNQTIICRDYNASGWGAPYICVMISLRSGTDVIAHINAAGAYTAVQRSFSPTTGQHLFGLTYNGSVLELWCDGVKLGDTSVSGDINWGDAGAIWHLGNNGSNEAFSNGVILRAGVEAEVWSSDRWKEEYLRIKGDWME